MVQPAKYYLPLSTFKGFTNAKIGDKEYGNVFVHETANDTFHKCVELATKIGKLYNPNSWNRDSFGDYMDYMEGYSGFPHYWKLWKDNEYGFYFNLFMRNEDKEWRMWFNGALLFFGKGDSGVSGPNFSVRMDSSDSGWCMHT